MKKTVLALTIVATLVCATMVWSQGGNRQGGPGRPGGPGGPGRGGGGFVMSCPAMAVMLPHPFMLDRLATNLQLTDEQSTKLSATVAKAEVTIKPLLQKSAASSKALKESILSATFDSKKTKELAAIAEKDETAVTNARIDGWTQIRSILMTEQASKLTKLMNAPRPGGGQRGGRGMGQGRGHGRGQGPAGPPPEDGGGFGPPPEEGY